MLMIVRNDGLHDYLFIFIYHRYLQHAIRVTKLYLAIEYVSKPVFKPFLTRSVQLRRMGDVHESQALKSDNIKTIQNSSKCSIIKNNFMLTNVY